MQVILLCVELRWSPFPKFCFCINEHTPVSPPSTFQSEKTSLAFFFFFWNWPIGVPLTSRKTIKWRKSIHLSPVAILQVQGSLPCSASGIHHVCSVTSPMRTYLSQMEERKGLWSYQKCTNRLHALKFLLQPDTWGREMEGKPALGLVCPKTWPSAHTWPSGPKPHPCMPEQSRIPLRKGVWVRAFFGKKGERDKARNREVTVNLTF